MSWRVFLLVPVLCIGCGSDDAADQVRGSGRFILTRSAPAPRTLVDGPAVARFCARDSILSVVVLGDRWNAALALRTAWPLTRHFSLDTLPDGIGTAAVGARSVKDSVGVALVSRSGSVELDAGALLAGHFTAEAGLDSTRVTLTGRFEGVKPDTTSCANPGGG